MNKGSEAVGPTEGILETNESGMKQINKLELSGGMTKREYIATHIAAALFGSKEWTEWASKKTVEEQASAIPRVAVHCADKLLEELERK